VQRIYACQRCHKETENRVHRCGQTDCEQVAVPSRGWPWLNNDMVNFVSSIASSLCGALLAWPFVS
jgi:hypothetical protein